MIFGTTAANVLAADGYTVSYYGTAEEGKTRLVEQSADYAYEGEYSLLVKYPSSSGYQKNTENYIEVKIPLTAEMSTGSYTLSLYNKGVAATFTEFSVSDYEIFGFSDMTKTDATAPSGESGWKNYSVTFAYEEQAEDFVALRFYGKTSTAAIDNISLVAEGSSQNLISDGGFEELVEQPEEAWDTTAYRPVNIMSIPYVGAIALSWANPSSDTLEKISVYDITDGEEILLADNFTVAASKLVNYEIKGLEDKTYQFKIVFEYSDKEDFVYFLSDKPAAKGSMSNAITLGKWTLSQALHRKAGYSPIEASMDYDVKYGDSGSSLKIASNIDRSRSDMNGNTYINIYTDLPLETGKKYSISFMRKSLNVSHTPQANMNGTVFDGESLTLPYTGTCDWKQESYTYTCTGVVRLRFLMEGRCEALWIDDIEVYELDSSGQRVGENLLPDGSLDNLASEEVGVLSDVDAEAEKESITLSWSAPSKNCSEIRLYEKKFDEYEYRGTLTAAAGEVMITNLEQDKEYTYKLCPVNADGFEGDGEEITAKTILPDYEVFETELYKESAMLEALSGSGSYKAVAYVKNNSVDAGINAELMAAVYKDGVMEALYSQDKLVAKTNKNKPAEQISVSFELPEGSGYHVEMFLVDARESLDILYPCKLYK